MTLRGISVSPAGRATFDILQLARDELRGELRRVLELAATTDDVVRSELIQQSTPHGGIRIDVRRVRAGDQKRQCFLVVFLATATLAEKESPSNSDSDGTLLSENRNLREELRLTGERLQWIVSERDARDSRSHLRQ